MRGNWSNLATSSPAGMPGRTSAEQITVFESQGMAIQDLAVALRVVAAARERGLGVELPLQ